MSSLLTLLLETADPRPERLAKILGKDKAEVERELEELRQNETILGWMPILNPEKVEEEKVRAVIEVKISPEREGGFDRMALRISRFEEVESCYLMSGGYDLLVFVSGKNLNSVALFISERLPLIFFFGPTKSKTISWSLTARQRRSPPSVPSRCESGIIRC
jgi:DNA-binding Lrp family transcriptional regulator